MLNASFPLDVRSWPDERHRPGLEQTLSSEDCLGVVYALDPRCRARELQLKPKEYIGTDFRVLSSERQWSWDAMRLGTASTTKICK